LVGPVDRSEDDASIVAAVIQFAHALGLSVTAEGIERSGQLERLIELGCDCGQGFLFSAPASIAGLDDSAAQGRHGRALRTQD
jgi:EAL domain-containing protein (putative c-di-GMP-specific phosphodiesterase class I)